MNIEIIEKKVIRKNTEIDLMIKIPTPVGKMKYFCKAKSKKRVSDGDLSSAYILGESRKLPVLFVINGKLTKKAETMMSEFKNNFTILNLD